MPFDAMKGLTEELRIREERRTRVPKRQLSEETMEDISRVLGRIERYDTVRVNFYSKGHYIEIDGEVASIDQIQAYLRIGNEKIRFEDIYTIERIES